MARRTDGRRTICHVLVEDPELAEAVPQPARGHAIDECIAPLARLPRGSWSGQEPSLSHDGVGLLVLDGLLIRRVGIDGRFGAELLGEGDLLRPWQGEDAPLSLPQTTGWRVLEDVRLAVLDRRVAQRLARYPELIGRLVGRAVERSRNLSVNMAIVHQRRIDIRLLMLFWHLAGRWGHVRPDGIALRLRLTHTVLAEIVGARRPTVSTALAELAEDGRLRPIGGAWLLGGHPPNELLELGARSGVVLPAGAR
jgi:CRP-like cAMP-binding protein